MERASGGAPGAPRGRAALPEAARAGAVALALWAHAGCAPLLPARRIDVDGHRLNLRCGGQGTPVVVMESGLGDTLATWEEVAPQVASFTRVCVYDRAGLGRSERGPLPRTGERIAAELHELLIGAVEPPPFVLVGHSMGGLYARLYASAHPERVAGVVLVEATPEEFPGRERDVLSPAELRWRAHALTHSSQAARSEFESIGATAARVRGVSPLPDVPLTVITADRPRDSARLRALWLELQSGLVALAPRGRQILVAECGHYVAFERPDVVIEAVREMVEEIRSGDGP